MLVKKRKNIFSNFSIFAFFCSNIFFLHFLVHGKLQKHSSVSLFSSYVLFPFYSLTFVNDVGEALNSIGFHKDCSFSMRNSLNSLSPSSMSGFFWYILVLRIYQKLFPTRVLAFPKSYYILCLILKVLSKNRSHVKNAFLILITDIRYFNMKDVSNKQPF